MPTFRSPRPTAEPTTAPRRRPRQRLAMVALAFALVVGSAHGALANDAPKADAAAAQTEQVAPDPVGDWTVDVQDLGYVGIEINEDGTDARDTVITEQDDVGISAEAVEDPAGADADADAAIDDAIARGEFSDAEESCLRELQASDIPSDVYEQISCLSPSTIIDHQAAYLEAATDATDAQVACVVERLEDLSVDELYAVAGEGIGQAAYVPCGLPD